MAQLAAGEAKSFEGLGRSHLVHEVTVDVDEAGAVVLTVDHMTVPDLVKQGARRGHLSRSLQAIVLLQQSGPENSALPGRKKGAPTGGRNRIRARGHACDKRPAGPSKLRCGGPATRRGQRTDDKPLEARTCLALAAPTLKRGR